MEQARQFRAGIVTFAGLACASMIGVLVCLLITSAEDYQLAYKSWNCIVTRESPPPQTYLYCLPAGLRFWTILMICASGCLGALLLNRKIAVDPAFEDMVLKPLVRFFLAALIAGALPFLQFYVSAYVIDFRGSLHLVIWFGAVAITCWLVFPEQEPIVLITLFVPLVLASIFTMTLLAMALGIVFD